MRVLLVLFLSVICITGINADDYFAPCRNSDIPTLEAFLAVPGNSTIIDSTGNSCLIAAIVSPTTLESVSLIIKNGADINQKEPKLGFTPLHMAVIVGNEEVVKLLLDSGAKVDIYSKPFGALAGIAPIHLATSKIKIFETILAKHNSPEFPDSLGVTPLFYAISMKSNAVAEKLIEKGADVNKKNREGASPLMIAASQGNLELVKLLIKAGALIEYVRESCGCTAFLFAAHNGYDEIVRELAKAGANVNAKEVEGDNALIPPAKKGFTETVKLLLELKVNSKYKDKAGKTALDYAKDNNHVKIINLLQDN